MAKMVFRNLVSNLPRRNLIGLFDQALASGATFFTSIVLGRVCSKDEFGLYTLAFSIVVAGMVLQNSLVLTPFTVFSTRLGQGEGSLYLGSTLVHQTVLSGLLVITLLGIAILTSFVFVFTNFGKTAFVLSAVLPFILLKEFARRISYAKFKVKSALIIDIFYLLFQVGGVVLIAYLGLLSASSAYLITGFASIVSVIFWFNEFRQEFTFSINHAISDFRRNRTLGKWIFFSGVAWMASTLLYPWFLGTMRGAIDVAIYGACTSVISLINPMLISFSNILEPTLSIAYAKGGLDLLKKPIMLATKSFSLVFGFITFVFIIFGNQIIVFIYGIKYYGNGITIGVIACNVFIMAMNLILSRTSFVVDRGDIDFKSNILSMFISFTIGILLVYYLGVLGAAIGLLLANLTGSILKYITLSTFFKSSKDN